MIFTSLNKSVIKMVSSRETNDTSNIDGVWKDNGKKTKWSKLFFVDDMGNEYIANVKGYDEATLYQDMEGREGFVQIKVEQFGKEQRVRYFAFDTTS